jgi:hypothetical protein
MNELTKAELNNLYSLAVREVQAPKEEVSKDDLAYKMFIDYWDKLADKLRILSEEKTGEN